jgi:hypothetical protein
MATEVGNRIFRISSKANDVVPEERHPRAAHMSDGLAAGRLSPAGRCFSSMKAKRTKASIPGGLASLRISGRCNVCRPAHATDAKSAG